MQFVLFLALGFALIVPGNLGNRPALDGGGNPDWISSTDVHQFFSQDIDCDGRRNCGEKKTSKEEMKDKDKSSDAFLGCFGVLRSDIRWMSSIRTSLVRGLGSDSPMSLTAMILKR